VCGPPRRVEIAEEQLFAEERGGGHPCDDSSLRSQTRREKTFSRGHHHVSGDADKRCPHSCGVLDRGSFLMHLLLLMELTHFHLWPISAHAQIFTPHPPSAACRVHKGASIDRTTSESMAEAPVAPGAGSTDPLPGPSPPQPTAAAPALGPRRSMSLSLSRSSAPRSARAPILSPNTGKPCLVCFDRIKDGVECELGHFTCRGCLQGFVRNLEPLQIRRSGGCIR